jgi:hypothetical protein
LEERIGLTADETLELDLSSYRVRVVPTAVLVDREGTVRFVHEGVLGPVEGSEIQSAIAAWKGAATGDRGGV